MTNKSETSTYNRWSLMRRRCNNPKHPAYNNYGGRGIKVCERWNNYDNFLKDMGEAPPGLTLDRIDVNGDYTPENCRWATRSQQARNIRSTRLVTIEGQTYVAADLAEKLGVKTDTLIQRAKVCSTYKEVMNPQSRSYTHGLALGGAASGAKKKGLTHCKNGHEYTEANTHLTKEGWRNCRACAREKYHRRRDRSRA